MAYGLGDQIENDLAIMILGKKAKRVSHKWDKRMKHRSERRRAKRDVECVPAYNRYRGWEF